MKQEISVLPVRCASCQRVFDLWRVLQEEEVSGRKEFGISQVLKENLCQVCRNSILAEEETGEMNYEISNELEMSLEYE